MKLIPLLHSLVLASCASSHPGHSIFGEPLYVNGKRISDDEIKLALIYGPCRQKLENLETNLIVDDEVARQEREHPGSGAAARALITEEEYEAEYEYNVDDFRKSYPTLDLVTEIRRAFRSVAWYREYLRAQQRFDRVFLPDDPADWPTTTVEAIKADENSGGIVLDDAKQSYAARLKVAAKNGRKPAREDPLYQTFLRQIVRDAVRRCITVKRHGDGIEPGLALWVDLSGDGRPELQLTIEELWELVRDTVTETDVDQTKQWFVTSTATRDRLRRDGALLTDEEAQAAIVRYMRESNFDALAFADSALHSFEFPSVESYVEYLSLRAGFERRIAPQLACGPENEPSAALLAHLPRANLTLGYGQVEAEVLLVAAMDIPHFSTKAGGWEQAKRQALLLRGQYERDPSPEHWSQLVDEHSEFWDYPPRQDHDGQRRTDCRDPLNHGRFGTVWRNYLMSRLGETDYSEWVTGDCLADRMTLEQEVGTVAGPFRGPLGWYLTCVKKRTPPVHPLQLGNPEQVKKLKEDYVRWAFIQYSKEAVAQADIWGWKPL